MNFFDTVAGDRFANYTIPSLVEELEKLNAKKIIQTCVIVPKDDAYKTIQGKIKEGYTVAETIVLDESVILVFEKEE